MNGPDYIQLYPTMRCDRSCGFCFNRSLHSVRDMTSAEFTALLAVCGKAGVRTIDIMGGEPTLHQDIIAFVSAAVSAGFSVNLSSNGTRPDVLDEIMRLGPRVTVGLSINDDETLLRMRGFIERRQPVVKSLFYSARDAALMRGILELKPAKYYLIYCDALHAAGLLDTVPFDRFLREAERFDPAGATGTVFCSGFLPDTATHPVLERVRCPAGTTKLGVMPDGSAYPCNLFFGRREFLLGNIFHDSFAHIWNNALLSFFREAPANTCPRRTCELHSRCHGGCPAHGFAHTGLLNAPDPRCSRNAAVREA